MVPNSMLPFIGDLEEMKLNSVSFAARSLVFRHDETTPVFTTVEPPTSIQIQQSIGDLQ